MKRGVWLVFIRTLNKWLTALFIISVVLVLSLDLWLFDIEAPNKFFVAMGKFNYGVAVSYIAAFIFYLITVHYPDTKSIRSAYIAANFPANAIVSNVRYIFIDMAKKLGEDIQLADLNEEVVRKILKKTKCYSDSTIAKTSSLQNGNYTFKNWLEYLGDKASVIRQFEYNLYPLYSKLDGDYVKALSLVEQDNALYQIMSMVPVAILSGKFDQATICFENGLDNIFLDLYRKVNDLDVVIKERQKTYDIT